ncbi:MAG TPA: serine/threonine-protein kinase [Ktedonobacteraceae bacterium]
MRAYWGAHRNAGEVLEHYQLVRRLDKRHGIEIWHAQHVMLQVPVVLKVVLSEHRDDKEYRRDERLLQNEARILSSLHHQYIIGYRDYLEGRNFCALVLEYAPYGSIVHRHGPGRKLPLFLVRLYVAQVSRALNALHQRGQIHRDVKPSNILLLDKHHAVLADFELAIDNPARPYTHKHYDGGTVPYMAPEQHRGAPCEASDQYSLAVCAYEWLTGHTPFSSETEETRMLRAARIPRAARIERPELPLAIDEIMWTALHADPARRYPGILDFARAFVEITRRGHAPLLKRWPYYRSTPALGASQDEEPSRQSMRPEEPLSASVPRLPETGEQTILRLPQLMPTQSA